jgi:hypothetical protein
MSPELAAAFAVPGTVVPPVLSDPGVLAFAIVGLLGGAHCLGMCGPLVTLYTDRMDAGQAGRANAVSWHELRQHTLFNLGRTGTYTLVGAALGALGGVVFDAAALATAGRGLRGVVGLAVGLAIVAIGVGYVRGGGVRGVDSLPGVGAAFQRVAGVLTARVDRLVDGVGIAGLGAVHALLPCPLLYPAYLYALASGSAITGALALAALGLGTLPTVFAYGTVFGSLSTDTRQRLHRVLGAVFVVLGTVPLTRGLAALGLAVPGLPLPMPPMP